MIIIPVTENILKNSQKWGYTIDSEANICYCTYMLMVNKKKAQPNVRNLLSRKDQLAL
jgi:hypothetical protein